MGKRNLAASTFVEEAIQSADDFRLGAALHTYADTYAHAGFTWRIGAAVNFNPELPWIVSGSGVGHMQFLGSLDDPSRLPRKATQAAMDIYAYLVQYAQRLRIERHPMVVSSDSLRAQLEFIFSSVRGGERARVAQWRDYLSANLPDYVPYEPGEPDAYQVSFKGAIDAQSDRIFQLTGIDHARIQSGAGPPVEFWRPPGLEAENW
jgi:hypothetical protein